MPNWAEGTIKLRGERQDIISALEEMFKMMMWSSKEKKIIATMYICFLKRKAIFTSMEQDAHLLIALNLTL